jgi:predicted Zn-dependent protease
MGTYFHVANIQPATILTALVLAQKSPSQGLWASTTSESLRFWRADDDKDDKSIIEKTLEAVKDFAAIAAEAAHRAMEPEPLKPGDEVVVMRMAAAGFMGEAVMPPFVIIPRRTSAPDF